ncbi:MAG: hypothetical protein JWQ45_1637 [Blastococcus sp.]|jgi:hypothetical protein|nr:hypothetical protein [Blastococcus sp.]
MLAALVLATLVLAAGIGGSFGRRGAIGLAVLSVLWFVVNGPMEGPVLVTVSSSHGVTGADLAGLVGLALAAHRWLALRGAARGTPSRGRRP